MMLQHSYTDVSDNVIVSDIVIVEVLSETTPCSHPSVNLEVETRLKLVEIIF
jgi:hypothetical protein